jgi:hypothetical protein
LARVASTAGGSQAVSETVITEWSSRP